jgi:hypothetical protein
MKESYGLPSHPRIAEYLKEAYSFSLLNTVDGLPVFSHAGSHYAGGYKFHSFLPVATKDGLARTIRQIRGMYGGFELKCSVPEEAASTKLVDFVFDASGISEEHRFTRYSKKTRNQVRKSRAGSLRAEVGPPPTGFYPLYTESLDRLGSPPRPPEWFARLERFLGRDVIAVSAYSDSTLAGVNYCLRHEDYILLMFNVSSPEFWPLCVNDLLYDELVAWSIRHGILYIDFGAAVAQDRSHNHFKLGFGARRYALVESYCGPWPKRASIWLSGKLRSVRRRFGI